MSQDDYLNGRLEALEAMFAVLEDVVAEVSELERPQINGMVRDRVQWATRNVNRRGVVSKEFEQGFEDGLGRIGSHILHLSLGKE